MFTKWSYDVTNSEVNYSKQLEVLWTGNYCDFTAMKPYLNDFGVVFVINQRWENVLLLLLVPQNNVCNYFTHGE